jgi:aspartate--ammonia ligase
MNLSILETQQAIKTVKTEFEKIFSDKLNLTRVSAPKFIKMNTGIQDDLANTCNSVQFHIKDCGYDVEIVHSLAKWKRIALQKYNIPAHKGIYTDMDAIRKDEKLDFMHSIYVDQWDWEMHISKNDRQEIFLRFIVGLIYKSIRQTNKKIQRTYNLSRQQLPKEIKFIHSEELEEMYPELTSKERENLIAKQYGAVFLIGIGYPLKDGSPHDLRAFDYDDWSTVNGNFHGLNGDIIVWNEVTQCSFEISSMGIRVDKTALMKQAEMTNANINTQYHNYVLDNIIPLSIGGGIGQSRLAMFLLEKRHIGEVQVSEWSESVIEECQRQNIQLL